MNRRVVTLVIWRDGSQVCKPVPVYWPSDIDLPTAHNRDVLALDDGQGSMLFDVDRRVFCPQRGSGKSHVILTVISQNKALDRRRILKGVENTFGPQV